MTNQQHPITPPPELFNKLKEEWAALGVKIRGDLGNYLVNNAYRMGADQELEACCHYFARDLRESLALELRAARRPNPPSLKEQALADFDWLVGRTLGRPEFDERSERIRRALEQLND